MNLESYKMIKITNMNQFKKLPKNDRDEIIQDRLSEAIDIFTTHYKDGKPYCDYGDGRVYEVDKSYAMTFLQNDLVDGGICKVKYRPHDDYPKIIKETWVATRYLDDEYWQERIVN
jgi:hypothetical protein